MKTEDFESLKRGLAQVAAYEDGARAGYRAHDPVDVKGLRERTGLTQKAFADTYGIPAGTLRDWEQNRRQPDAPARALLRLIARDATAVAAMLAD